METQFTIRRRMVSNEIRSGEIRTHKAKRVLYPLLLVYLINFVSFVVRSQLTGYYGTTGAPDTAGYSVVEHGHTFHVTAGQYWLSRIQILLLIAGVIAWFVARACFFRTGDLIREEKAI